MFSFFVNGSTALVGLGLLTVWGSDITLRHTTLGRTPLEEWLACCRDLYRTTHNTHKRQTDIHAPVGFEPTIPVSKQPQTYALDHTATGIGHFHASSNISSFAYFLKRCIHTHWWNHQFFPLFITLPLFTNEVATTDSVTHITKLANKVNMCLYWKARYCRILMVSQCKIFCVSG